MLVIVLVEPPAGIEPATPSLPWNHREPLCGPPFSQVEPDRRGQSYRFSLAEVMRSLTALRWLSLGQARNHTDSFWVGAGCDPNRGGQSAVATARLVIGPLERFEQVNSPITGPSL